MAIRQQTRSYNDSPNGDWTIVGSIDTTTGEVTYQILDSSGKKTFSGTVADVINGLTVGSVFAATVPGDDPKFYLGMIPVVNELEAALKSQYPLPPPTETAGTAASGPTPDEPKQLTGAADGDSKQDGPVEPDKTPETQKVVITGKTPKELEAPLEDKRMENPLSAFSSYTYQLTLYLTSPYAYNAFLASDRTQVNTRGSTTEANLWSYIVAQSAGVNDALARAPYFDVDYHIDDLKITSSINGKETRTESNITGMTFTIYEPYGFSFISKLRAAQDAINKITDTYYNSEGRDPKKAYHYVNLINPTRQFFILGIRFQGYDSAGNQITAENFPSPDNVNPAASGVYERFYDIVITEMKFKLDGRMVAYNCRASSVATNVAFANLRGRVPTNTTLAASTVGEALVGEGNGVMGMMTFLNSEQKSRKIPNVYKVKFVGEAENSIKNATLISKADLDKNKWAWAKGVDSSIAVNESAADVVNSNIKQFVLNRDTSIMQSIRQIIAQSSYLEDAIKVIEDSIEDARTDPTLNQKSESKRRIKWFNLGSIVKCLGFDQTANDFAYEITYVIQEYETPAAVNIYTTNPGLYYSPAKRYEYWFTGKNSEIINFEQTLDNAYHNVVLGDKSDLVARIDTTPLAVPLHVNASQEGEKMGRLDVGMSTQNSYITNLKDPGSLVKANITILGDPDFLMRDTPGAIQSVYNTVFRSGTVSATGERTRPPSGVTVSRINPSSGQVFVEIDFKEAVDYDNNTGTMTLNDQISLWGYPKIVKKIVKGISYLVVTVVSNFSKGKFTQDLSLVLNTFPGVTDKKGEATPTSDKSAGSGDARESATSSTAQLSFEQLRSSELISNNSIVGGLPPVPTTAGIDPDANSSGQYDNTSGANDDGVQTTGRSTTQTEDDGREEKPRENY